MSENNVCVCRDEFEENPSTRECEWGGAEEFKSTELGAQITLITAGANIVPLLFASSPFMFMQFLQTVEYLR